MGMEMEWLGFAELSFTRLWRHLALLHAIKTQTLRKMGSLE